MAKGGFGKFLAGVAVIGAGVALGLTVYNHADKIRRELNDDEFEDDFDDDSDDISSSADKAYVKINTDNEKCSQCDLDKESEETMDAESNTEPENSEAESNSTNE